MARELNPGAIKVRATPAGAEAGADDSRLAVKAWPATTTHAIKAGTALAAALLLVVVVGCQPVPQEPAAAGPVRGPTHDLSVDEAAGGHTLRRHVGRTDDELKQRLQKEPHLAAASTYTDRATAEQVVGSVLQGQRERIAHWLERSGHHPNLVLDYDGDAAHPIGRTLRRGATQPEPCSRAVVVLRWAGGDEYYVLTTYPECG
jgi:CDI toxin RNase A-like protein